MPEVLFNMAPRNTAVVSRIDIVNWGKVARPGKPAGEGHKLTPGLR